MTLTMPEALLAPPAADDAPLMPLRWQDRSDEVREHLQTALDVLAKRRPLIDARWRYYLGQHDELWMTQQVREVFGGKSPKLDDNYCELAVEAVVLRLAVKGWTARRPDRLGEQAATAMVAAVQAQVEANGLDLEQEELHRAAGVAGEHYLMVWPRYANTDNPDDDTVAVDEDGVQLWDITEQDARNVYLHVAAGRQKRYAVKVWRDEPGKRWRASIYYGDEVVRLRTVQGSNGSEPPKALRFDLDPDDPGGDNPVGAPPFVRFARDKRGRSRLDSLSPVQDKLNKLSVGKMVAAEFAALTQRYALTDQQLQGKLRAIPGSVWQLSPGGETEDGTSPPTRVGEFSAADLSQFDSAKREEVDTFLTIGMLPRNLRISGAAGTSGEAITKDAGPFISMVEDHQLMYGGAWRDLWALCGYDVVPSWEPAETANSKAVAEEVKLLVDAGVPLEVALRHVGWTQEQLDAVLDALEDAEERSATASARALRALDTGDTTAVDQLRQAAQVGAPADPPQE